MGGRRGVGAEGLEEGGGNEGERPRRAWRWEAGEGDGEGEVRRGRREGDGEVRRGRGEGEGRGRSGRRKVSKLVWTAKKEKRRKRWRPGRDGGGGGWVGGEVAGVGEATGGDGGKLRRWREEVGWRRGWRIRGRAWRRRGCKQMEMCRRWLRWHLPLGNVVLCWQESCIGPNCSDTRFLSAMSSSSAGGLFKITKRPDAGRTPSPTIQQQ